MSYTLKIFFGCCFIIFITPIYAQRFTPNDLIVLLNSDRDKFDTHVVQNGYVFGWADNNDNETIKSYSYLLNKSSDKANKFISKYIYVDGKKSISWQTPYVEDYALFKKQMIAAGFKYSEAGKFEESSYLVYTRGKLFFRLYSFKSEANNGTISTVYEVALNLK